MPDQTITCADCHQEFVWTIGEQDFYTQKNLQPPKYCLICRGKYKAKQTQFAKYSSKNHPSK